MGESLQAEYKLAAQDMRAIEEGFSKERSYTEALKAATLADLIEKQLQNAKVCSRGKVASGAAWKGRLARLIC